MARILMAVLVAGGVLASASVAGAQQAAAGPTQERAQQVSPGPTQDQTVQQMEMMGPAMAKMTEGMYTGMLRALARPESAEQLATFMKNYRDALVAKGFTREEANQIVKGTGIPGAATMK
jgi:hypothetical protein